jgi:hypothetical protein
MEITERAAAVIQRVLDSYLAATGQTLEDIFKMDKGLEEAYMSVNGNKEITEATPKSTLEKMYRKTRHKTTNQKAVHMTGRVVPKKTANNDPRRGGNRIHNEKYNEHLNATVNKLEELLTENTPVKTSLRDFKYAAELKELLEHMIAVSKGGWKLNNGILINETGRIASPQRWTLKGDYLICQQNGRTPNYNINKLVEIRKLLS